MPRFHIVKTELKILGACRNHSFSVVLYFVRFAIIFLAASGYYKVLRQRKARIRTVGWPCPTEDKRRTGSQREVTLGILPGIKSQGINMRRDYFPSILREVLTGVCLTIIVGRLESYIFNNLESPIGADPDEAITHAVTNPSRQRFEQDDVDPIGDLHPVTGIFSCAYWM